MHHGHGRLISRKQKWFNTWKSINMLYQMNRHHMIISTDAERAFDKNPTFLHNKNTRQTRKRRCYDLFLPVEHLWHQMCGVLPQANNQFSPNSPNTSWMTYNAFPFWHWLRGASTKLRKRRAQSHALRPSSDANHRSQASWTSDQLAVSQGFPQPPPQEFVKTAHRERKKTLYLHLWLIVKGVIKDTDEQPDEGVGEGARTLPALFRHSSFPAQRCILKVLPTPQFKGFMKVSLHRHDWLHCWSLTINSIFSPFPSPQIRE